MQDCFGQTYRPAPYTSYAWQQTTPANYPPTQPTESWLVQYTYPLNMSSALRLIQEAVAGETEDRMFYQFLIDNAPSQEDREIIAGIRDDEISHFELFRYVYYQLTGQTLPPPMPSTLIAPATYCDGVAQAIRGEQNAVRKYRQILFALQDRQLINILTGIITDEIRHGSLYNYLYTRNGCRG